MLMYEMLKPCSLFPMQKLGTRPLPNVKRKLPDDGTGGAGYGWVQPET